ncbi:MAG: MFS transporter [Coprobacillaceae bacterium]
MKKKLILNYIAILILFLGTGAGTFENAATQSMIEAWPEVATASIRSMITLPCLISMVTMILVGRIVGRKISYRHTAIIGSILIIIGGISPFFIHSSWSIILMFRVILGVGVGCLSIRNPLLVNTVPPEQLAKFIGLGNVVSSIMSVLIAPLVGHLTTYGWQYAFLSNSFAIIVIILVMLFLKEPKKQEEIKNIEKIKIPNTVFIYIIIQFFATMSLYPLLSGISTYLHDLNIGSATIAGYMLSIYTSGGIITNLLLNKIHRNLKGNALPLAFILPIIGVSLVIASPNIIVIGLGVFISGVGFTIVFSLLQVLNGRVCDEQSVAQGSTLILAANQLAVFLSSYFIEITAHFNIFDIEMKNPYFICVIIYIFLAISSVLFKNKINITNHNSNA